MFAYPSILDQNDLAEVINAFTPGATTVPIDAIRAGWSVAGYVMSQAHPLPPNVKGAKKMTRAEVVAALKSLQPGGVKKGWGDVDWCCVLACLTTWIEEYFGLSCVS